MSTPAADGAYRPRLLDLFCGEGGAGHGYHLAGFDVTGVDTVDRSKRYPHTFVQADALAYLAAHGHEYDAVHASPPCHDHTPLVARSGADGTGDLLAATLAALRAQDRPWIVENVEGARAQMPGALMLCGSEFGLILPGGGGLRRHRLFLSSFDLWGAGGCAHGRVPVLGVYGDLGGSGLRGTKASKAQAAVLMGMPWATGKGLSLAIPPVYTRFLGEQMLDSMAVAA